MVCAREGNVEKAFELYEEAYSRGVLATDECHNILITICADAGRSALASLHHCWPQHPHHYLCRCRQVRSFTAASLLATTPSAVSVQMLAGPLFSSLHPCLLPGFDHGLVCKELPRAQLRWALL